MKALKTLLKIIFFLHIIGAVCFLSYFLIMQEKYTAACNACHEMRSHKSNLKFAMHDNIECNSCHDQDPVFKMLYRKTFAGKDKFKNIKISSGKCSECHPHMEDTTVFYHDTNFSHRAHMDAGEECSTCHKKFVHRSSPRDTLLSLRLCRSCHQEKRRRHEPPVEIADLGMLEKQPHDEDWYVEHKGITESEKKACAECHHQDFCVNCHNNYEAHVVEWWANHYDDAMMRLAECQICHRPAYCISCHSKTVPVNHNEAWGISHWVNSDLLTCNECHTLNFCKACHTREMPSSHKAIKDHAGMEPEREPMCNVCHGRNSCSSCHHSPEQSLTCLSCHKDDISSVKKLGGKSFAHSSHLEKHGVTCNMCHEESGAPGEFETIQNCDVCHHDTTTKRCTDCHKRHKAEVKQSDMDFPCSFCHKQGENDFDCPSVKCISCHALMFEQEAQVHGAKSCTKCHPSHSRQAQPYSSCKGCHENHMAKHKEEDVEECSKCHTPHLWKVSE